MWSRQDELGWAPFGPAAVVRVAADLDAAGDVLAWRHEIWGNGHVGRPGMGAAGQLLAATHRAEPAAAAPSVDPPAASGGGAGRNAVPPYAFPALRVVNHRLLTMPLRTSALRSLGAFANVFAAESFVDEIVRAVGADPVEYRLRHLDDPRARAVVEAVARRAGWADRRRSEAVGHGIAFARYKNSAAYCAVVAEVAAEHEVRVRRLTLAVDAGLAVNPDGLANQIEGGAVQATSWTVKEQVRFDRRRVVSDTWETYPILRFSEVPAVDVEIVDRRDEPSLGVGEAAAGPTAAAIANALCDAIGVRVRRLPLSAENVVAAMEG
jgi:CO/xanthine dehydrogenase Mo-binding subunit